MEQDKVMEIGMENERYLLQSCLDSSMFPHLVSTRFFPTRIHEKVDNKTRK
jgi:hypothetical protein